MGVLGSSETLKNSYRITKCHRSDGNKLSFTVPLMRNPWSRDLLKPYFHNWTRKYCTSHLTEYEVSLPCSQKLAICLMDPLTFRSFKHSIFHQVLGLQLCLNFSPLPCTLLPNLSHHPWFHHPNYITYWDTNEKQRTIVFACNLKTVYQCSWMLQNIPLYDKLLLLLLLLLFPSSSSSS